MTYRGIAIAGCAILFGLIGSSAASAQSAFRNYRCADGTQFIALFTGVTRANLQLDGKAVLLKKRFSLTGARYSGSGVSLQISRAGLVRLKHGKQPWTACDLA
ncbi:MliC family protein [Bradyrhizobium tropiciagri]|uniref:MliC family protein n=1 Tax=Bradyrhizobium tropiciagri TaxID=312253 RepID=UPI001BAC99FE|nr:MliC family protein [Bradyrhizobium tropiciagri]MBR0870985.1 MliC family protein [Bradyrhizobium tropiciagri]